MSRTKHSMHFLPKKFSVISASFLFLSPSCCERSDWGWWMHFDAPWSQKGSWCPYRIPVHVLQRYAAEHESWGAGCRHVRSAFQKYIGTSVLPYARLFYFPPHRRFLHPFWHFSAFLWYMGEAGSPLWRSAFSGCPRTSAIARFHPVRGIPFCQCEWCRGQDPRPLT